MRLKTFTLLFSLFIMGAVSQVQAQQQSVARQWCEVLLEGIRHDYARPVVHARNLFHTSVVMYDAWAAYDSVCKPYMLGDTVGGYYTPFTGMPTPANLKAAREEAIAYAAYRLIRFRFRNAPGKTYIYHLMDSVFYAEGYDTLVTSIDYTNDGPAALGNYIAQNMITYGHTDGSNELGDYSNLYYQPVNTTLLPVVPGNPNITDPNRWQPLTLDVYVDQSGNVLPVTTRTFLGAEWGNLDPFSLRESDKETYTRGGHDYNVWMDAGPPPHIDPVNDSVGTAEYMYSFELVAVWSSQLDTSDGVLWDISPASIGNLQSYPTDRADYPNFYDIMGGGDNSPGYTVNPVTGQPYTPQIVHRGDYARVLAEFWADGPNSETPPGHWFTIINYVHDHPLFQKRWRGQGPILDDLEWDVKAYFTLGGAVHDAAIASWSNKGWYDYIRPISAIRYMAAQGQSTSDTLPSYSPNGIKLIPGVVELVYPGDTLAGTFNQHVGEIKLKAWRGPTYINDPDVDDAGVGWILAGNWWPYQRPTFVTPPFGGYISGHSTYSRTAAEVLTMITGSPYFPGGMGEFHAPQNQFLVFEEGPTEDVTLQWATYRDASDQCSLSRIWGGIHPPADDIPGRLQGIILGPEAVYKAEEYFGLPDMRPAKVLSVNVSDSLLTDADVSTAGFVVTVKFDEDMNTAIIPTITFPGDDPSATIQLNGDSCTWTDAYTYVGKFNVANSSEVLNNIDLQVSLAQDPAGNDNVVYTAPGLFKVETENPTVTSLVASAPVVTPASTGTATFTLTATFSEDMDPAVTPLLSFPVEDPLAQSLVFNTDSSGWLSSTEYKFAYDATGASELLNDIDVMITGGADLVDNVQVNASYADFFDVNTMDPAVMSVVPSANVVADATVGSGTFTLDVTYDEDMDTTTTPVVNYTYDDPMANTLTLVSAGWISLNHYKLTYDVADASETLSNVNIEISGAKDVVGNTQSLFGANHVFGVDTKNPTLLSINTNVGTITNVELGPAGFKMELNYSEDMDQNLDPIISFPAEDPLATTLSFNADSSGWISGSTYRACYDVAYGPEKLLNIDVEADLSADMAENSQQPYSVANRFSIFTEDTSTGIPAVDVALIQTYPNPTTGTVTVEFPGDISGARFMLCDLQGEEVYSRLLTKNRTDMELDFSAGVYLYKILLGEKVLQVDKLVIK